jgi:hypothetical protein
MSGSPDPEFPIRASRNLLLLPVVGLVAGLAVTGYALCEGKKQPGCVEISVGRSGLSIKET